MNEEGKRLKTSSYGGLVHYLEVEVGYLQVFEVLKELISLGLVLEHFEETPFVVESK